MSDCKLCGKSMNHEESIKYLDLYGVCVCDGCARAVADAYENWHGGQEKWGTNSTKGVSCSNLSGKVRWRVFKRDGYRCVLCGVDSDLTIDHIHPQSKGGTNSMLNLQTMCRSCNSSKGARV